MITIGNSEITGSIYIDGGRVYATASWSEYAISASGENISGVVSNAWTASVSQVAWTGSYITGSGVDGIVREAYSASYVIGLNLGELSSGSVTASIQFDVNGSGSFHINDDTVITGSLTVLGGIIGVDTSLISSGSATASIKIDGDNTGSFHINTDTTISGSLNVLGGIKGIDTSLISSGSGTASIQVDISGSSSLHINTNTFITGALWVSGGVEVFGDMKIYGTQSVEYITSSQLNIGTNIITVNTDTPAVRFGGLAVYDSGSTGRTGSLLWDSQRNNWIYTNPSGSSYDGAVVLMGPENVSGSGNEETINEFSVVIGQGNHHLTSSALIVSESKFISSIPTIISESLSVTGSSTLIGNEIISGSLTITGSLILSGSAIHLRHSASVSGTNVFGTASWANNAFTASFLSTSIYVREIHVSAESGDDVSGSGKLLQPYKSLNKALDVVTSGQQIVIHPGTYTASFNTPTNANNITITAANTEIGGLVNLTGTASIDQTVATVRLVGLTVGHIIHSGNKNLYLQNVTVGGSVQKTGAGYLEVRNSTIQAGTTSITGAGQVVIYNSLLGVVNVNNASAVVNLTNNIVMVTPTCQTGTMLIDGGVAYSTGASTGAVFSSGGVVVLKDLMCFTPAGASARISLSPTGAYSMQNVFFDRANSTTGVSLVNKAHFQHIQADALTGSQVITDGITVGSSTVITPGNGSIGMGLNTLASGIRSFVGGNSSTASGADSFAFGNKALADGEAGFAVGRNVRATGVQSVAFGSGSWTQGNFSMAVGRNTSTNADYALAAGFINQANGESSVAFGSGSVASGKAALVFGTELRASSEGTIAFGKYNTTSPSKESFVIGNGRSSFSRNDLLVATGSSITISGSLNMAYPSGSAEVTGANIFGTASWAMNTVNGGAVVTVSGSAPTGAFQAGATGSATGSLWWNTEDGNLYVQVGSPTGSTWVPAVASVAGGEFGATSDFSFPVAATTWSISHNFGTTTPIVQVYAGSNVIVPSTITAINSNTLQVTFATATAGTAKVSTGVGGPTTASFAVSAGYLSTGQWNTTESVTITAITTNPTKPTSRIVDYTRYKLLSQKSAQVDFRLGYTSNAGATFGNGQYLFKLPTGIQFDTTIHPLYTGDNSSTIVNNATVATLAYSIPAVGMFANDAVDVSTNLFIVPYTSTTYRVCYAWGTAETTIISSGFGNLPVARALNWSFEIAIQ